MSSTVRCRQCGQSISFRETPNGRWQPIDPATGAVHFHKSPPPAPDDECARCHSRDVERTPGTAMHYAGLRCHACGAFRWLRQPAAEVRG